MLGFAWGNPSWQRIFRPPIRRGGKPIYWEEQPLLDLLDGPRQNVNARDRDGRTALMWAVTTGNPILVRRCLRMGARVHYRDADGHTALMRAEGMGYPGIAALLRRAGARH
jgi:ankyrin repeat protein